MRIVVRIVSLLALAATIAPSALFLAGTMELGAMKQWMLGATIVWFVATPWWMD